MYKTEMYNKIINAIDVLSRVQDEDVLFALEDNHLKTILRSIERLYDNKCKKLDEENMSYAIEYLNSFAGK